jgi:DNA-binding HxlR family transcriptional regulator
MKNKSFAEENCAIARCLEVVGHWWTLLIIREAFSGVSKFGDFQERLGIARNILTVRLKKLVDDGILQMENNGGGLRCEYFLTDKGRELVYILVALSQWGNKWLFPSGRPVPRLVDKQDLLELAPLEIRSRNGRILGNNDLEFLRPDNKHYEKE